MILRSNKIHRNTVRSKPHTIISRMARSSKDLVTGDIIINLGPAGILKTVILIGFLLVLYISNSYWVEYKINQKVALEQTLEELRFRQKALKNEVYRLQKYTLLQEQLSDRGLKTWLEPPYHIKPTKVKFKTPPN